MRAELTALQEDFLLEQSLERKREAQEIEQERGIKNCEFCKVDRASEKVKIEGGEVCFLCEGCKEELEATQEEYEGEGYCDNPYCLKQKCEEHLK